MVEEQLHRAASLGLQHDPKLGIMQLHSRSVELTVASSSTGWYICANKYALGEQFRSALCSCMYMQ